ncbi:MAG: Gfo/Idh/MocA family oxidoreductase [Chloroflexi bacterium]|nr:Gfo/Idh/MocA family oxidoreductase [Chloroflexota bacterium]MXX51530.1 Gfo/Idh/MocA family oxidoreductase [Chloroflexota bacterium]MYA93337.1 Gfo/Idh/MocA family oxidoreductase [Chloroflexota bacterium]MYD37317.1 Gfo/Idh/MocA family oxidoreductase [Chloroflexota bacterium]MYE78695.1 Gfo/Idh/MocA family oxidoreductase [Chloroflexota bacterium]
MLNIGILGAGGIAALSHLPEIAEVPGLRVTHICGRREGRLRLLCERFAVPRYSTSWRDLLEDPALDAVIVALPHPLHAEAGLAVLEQGLHLFMQKPLCTTLAEADQLLAASEARPQQVVYCRPSFSAVVYAMRRLLAAGAIGTISGALARHSHGGPEVYYAEVSDSFDEPRMTEDLWFYDADNAGGGALIDMGVYAIANIVALLGEVEAVSARMSTVAKPTALEDSATLILEMADGALATAETGWCDPARSSYLRVHGTAGKLQQVGDEIAYIRPGSYEREWATPITETISPPAAPNQHGEWLRCIKRGEQPALSNLWTARHIMEIMLAAVESNQQGRRVAVHSQPRALLPAL